MITMLLETHFFERKNDVKTMKQKISMDTLNDNINNAKSYPVTVLHSPFCNQKNFPFGCFLAADRGDIYIINTLTLKISLIILLTVCHTVLVMFFWRIWYWIKLYSLNFYFLRSHHSSAWYCFDIVRRILSWSLMGVKGLKEIKIW